MNNTYIAVWSSFEDQAAVSAFGGGEKNENTAPAAPSYTTALLLECLCILGGGVPGLFLEGAAEIAEIGKAAPFGDQPDGRFRLNQLIFGFCDAAGQ